MISVRCKTLQFKIIASVGDCRALRARFESRCGETYGVVFENRSAAYIKYVSTGSAENRVR